MPLRSQKNEKWRLGKLLNLPKSSLTMRIWTYQHNKRSRIQILDILNDPLFLWVFEITPVFEEWRQPTKSPLKGCMMFDILHQTGSPDINCRDKVVNASQSFWKVVTIRRSAVRSKRASSGIVFHFEPDQAKKNFTSGLWSEAFTTLSRQLRFGGS